ncbi:MAG: hypothetical protein HY756_12105 [Nitrospirae bacterium]|nr:hypothetical protein [Nitrospirota bacterium]
MKFYVKQHKYYCGVDLHARSLYVCIIDKAGEVVKHKNIEATPEAFLNIIRDCRTFLSVRLSFSLILTLMLRDEMHGLVDCEDQLLPASVLINHDSPLTLAACVKNPCKE